MENITITEIAGEYVKLDQRIDADETIATAGGVAIGGNLSDSAVNTGRNDGIMAGNDVTLDDSIVGHGNEQINDSHVGAFASRGSSATNAVGENVNIGSGDLNDVDAHGDVQLVTGSGNDVRGDVDFDVHDVDGPVNLAAGDGNRQYALEDNSTNVEDSFNKELTVEDSFNTVVEQTFTHTQETNELLKVDVDDSFNKVVEDNDTYEWSSQQTWTDKGSYDHDWSEMEKMGDWDGGDDFDLDF